MLLHILLVHFVRLLGVSGNSPQRMDLVRLVCLNLREWVCHRESSHLFQIWKILCLLAHLKIDL
jgi:hypothetical protein